jgi:hypothetical protein
MPATHTIDQENRWVHTMIWGVVSGEDLLPTLERGLVEAAGPNFDPSFAEIIDLTEVMKMELSEDDVRELAEKSPFSPNSRRAIVVPDNKLVDGFARMYEVLREVQGETGIRIFRSLDEAFEWVRQSKHLDGV